MNKDECYYLGYVAKTRGHDGRLILSLDVDDPLDYADMDRVLIDMHGALTPFFIDSVTVRDGRMVEVHIEDIDTREQASTMTGKELYLPLTDLPQLPDDQYYLHDLIGMEVVDVERGLLGRVAEVFDHDRNPLMQLLPPEGEILIPLEDEFIHGVDKAAGRITVELPEGMIDLNRS